MNTRIHVFSFSSHKHPCRYFLQALLRGRLHLCLRLWVIPSLIPSPDFSSLRLERVDSENFIRPDSVISSSRTLHLMDLRRVSSASAIAPGFELHPPAMDVKVRVLLPKRGGLDPNVVVRKHSVSFGAQLSYEIVNSVNGLICLRKASICNGCKSPCIVCNPFTGGYSAATKDRNCEELGCCSARNNVYMVVWLVYGASASNPFDIIAEVYTILEVILGEQSDQLSGTLFSKVPPRFSTVQSIG